MSTLAELREQEIAKKRIVVGFDGFVDTIVRPVRCPAAGGESAQMFETIREFGEYLISKAEKSCSIELSVESRQLGGNLPFLSRAAGGLGLDVTCIGMLGENGAVDPIFREMPCTLHPFSAPGQSTCMEFRDGKVLLSSDCTLPDDPWGLVQKATAGRAPELFQAADLVALVNWSELSFAHGLWEKVYSQALAGGGCDKSRFAFFDLCDCSRRADVEMDAVLKLIGAFSAQRTAILSLNENEAQTLSSRLLHCGAELDDIGEHIRGRYGVDEVIIHTIRESLLSSERGTVRLPVDFVEVPVISTGAGDNFNAACCFGAVMGLSDRERLAFASRFATFYVANGYSASLGEAKKWR